METMTQAEYARYRGVSPPAISKLISNGKIPESAFTVGPDGKRRIDVAAADFALGESRERILSADDPAPTLGLEPETVAAAEQNPSDVARLTKWRAETESYKARTAELELDEKLGRLLATEDVTRSMERCAAIIVREIDQLPNFAEDLVGANARDGVQGVRVSLKNIARNIRLALEKNMRVAKDQDGEEAAS